MGDLRGVRRGELGDGLGALGHGMLGQLSGEHEADGGLHLTRGEGGLLVVAGELAGLAGNALEHVVDEGVHDGHPALGDAGVWVYLLEDLVDVRGVRLQPLVLPLLVTGLLGGLGGLLRGGLGHLARVIDRRRSKALDVVVTSWGAVSCFPPTGSLEATW